jgi:hypothetical protein
MKTMIMKRSGKRLLVSDRKAAIYMLMGIAFEDLKPVVKKVVPVKSIFDEILDAGEAAGDRGISLADALDDKPKQKRRYRRRDMRAEESNCSQESNE